MHSFFSVSPILLYVFLGSSLLLLLVSVFWKSNARWQRLLVIGSIFLFLFFVGALRYQVSQTFSLSLPFESRVGEKVQGRGVLTEEPDERENSTLLTVKMIDNSKIKILLISERYPQFEYGDVVDFVGVLEKPKPFETDSGRLFDYPKYLAKDGIYYEIFYPKIELVERGKGNFIKENLLKLKTSFVRSISLYINEPEASLLGGLLIGAKHGLSKEWQETLRNAGIIHIIVLSGYNITIVAEAIMALFSFLAIRFRFIVGALAILLFAIMTGGSATVVRASVMALLVLLARVIGRTYAITRALTIAGIAMILYNPKILVFDPSFQLSFLATLGLVYISPLIEKNFQFVSKRFQLREVVVATIATQIFVLPLLLFMMGEVSVVSLLVNLLVLLFIPLTMLFGFITGSLGFLSSTLAFPFAYVTHLLLYYELSVASFFGNLSFATVSVSNFGTISLVTSYIFIILVVSFFYNKKAKNIDL